MAPGGAPGRSLLHACSLQGEPELDKLVESWGLYTLETWDFFFLIGNIFLGKLIRKFI